MNKLQIFKSVPTFMEIGFVIAAAKSLLIFIVF